ncbi:MAG: alpha/beta fold hydrolase [Clostridia bacterium]|nr:alpha/beta fold hydrolase [Clostridia bacterium]
MNDWFGFEVEDFIFEGKNAKVVFANESNRTNKWLFKTEYFGAFPDLEIEMLKQGYNLAHVDNSTRWCKDEDTDRQAKFAEYLHDKYGFDKKCVPVGMSCGGMQAIFLAAKYPHLTAALYIDAPVVNFLSCPAGLGAADNSMFKGFSESRNISLTELLSFRNNPLDKIPELVKNNIPIFLVCGDSDTCVPYEENGKLVYDAYKKAGCDISLVLKPGCDHHPHGLTDNTPIIEFIKKYY